MKSIKGRVIIVVMLVFGVLFVHPGTHFALALKRQTYLEGMYSQSFLERIVRNDSENYAVRYYLGMLHLREGDGSAAINEWEHYINKAPIDGRLMTIRERLTVLKRMRAQSLAEKSLKQDPQALAKRIKPNTVAVLNFTNHGSAKYNPLAKGLAGMIITDLLKVPRLEVVERERVQALFDEVAMQKGGLLDVKQTVRLGKFLMAENIIWGRFIDRDEHTVEITYSITETRNATRVLTKTVKGALKDLIKLEKEVAFGILETIGVKKEELSSTVLEALQQFQTHDVNAFLAYSEGLEHLDRGNYETAKSNFYQAAQMDPGFRLAKEAMHDTPDDPAFAEFLQHMNFLQFHEPRHPDAGDEPPPEAGREPHPDMHSEPMPLDPDTGRPMEPRPEFRMDPDTGRPVAFNKGLLNQLPGLPIDAVTGLPFDPDTGQLINPLNGEPIPMEEFKNNPDFRREVMEMIQNNIPQEPMAEQQEEYQKISRFIGLNGDGAWKDPQRIADSEAAGMAEPEPQPEEGQMDAPDQTFIPKEAIAGMFQDAINPDPGNGLPVNEMPDRPTDIVERWGYLIGPLMVKTDTSESFATYVFNRDLHNLNNREGTIEWGADTFLRYNGENPSPVPALSELVINGKSLPVGELQLDFMVDPDSEVSGDLRWYYWTLENELPLGDTGKRFTFNQKGFSIFGNPTERNSDRVINLANNNMSAFYGGFSRGVFLDGMNQFLLKGSFRTLVNFNTGALSEFSFLASSGSDEGEIADYSVSLENGVGKLLEHHLLNFEILSGTWKVNTTDVTESTLTDARGALYGPDAQHIGGIWSIKVDEDQQAHGIFVGNFDSDSASVTDTNTDTDTDVDTDTENDTDTNPAVRQGLMIGQLRGSVQVADGNTNEVLNTCFYTPAVQDFNAGGQLTGAREGSRVILNINEMDTVSIFSITLSGDAGPENPNTSITMTENPDQNDAAGFLTWGTWNQNEPVTINRAQGDISVGFYENNYYIFGVPTANDQLNELAGANFSATYTGKATGTMGVTVPVDLDEGGFTADVNFTNGAISNFNLNARSSQLTDKHISIAEAQGAFEPGSADFMIRADTGAWEINGAEASGKDARGAFFGNSAAAMGGIWRLEGEGENRAHGIFVGKQPQATDTNGQ